LPIKLTGRHYADNLARTDVLLSSLAHYLNPGTLAEIVVVTPDDELPLVEPLAHTHAALNLRFIGEADCFPEFKARTRPWQVRPWQRQQIIKLAAPSLTTADVVLTLDPDVLALRQMGREDLVPGGRAIMLPEARTVHSTWWRDSAHLLGVTPDLDLPGIGVTPALLDREILIELQGRIAHRVGRPWVDALLTTYSDWTEYTLYLLAARHLGMLDSRHLVPPPGSTQLQVPTELSVWSAAEATPTKVATLLASGAQGLFGIVQSNTGLDAATVAQEASHFFPINRTTAGSATGEPRPAPRWKERARTGSRLAAAAAYRARRSAKLVPASPRTGAAHRPHGALSML